MKDVAQKQEQTNRLEIRQLSKTYPGGVHALNHVNLTLTNGIFGLLGPNGAGKSSLMRTIATLQSPDKGSITFNGSDILSDPEPIRRALGYLPQEFGVFPKATARRLLAYVAALKGLPVKGNTQIDKLLELTNLSEHQHRRVSTFSGGMLRRFGIAQALLGSPKILIVDEPTAGLDPEERHRFHRLLARVAEHMIVILSTHLVEDIHHLCSRLAVLYNGRLRFQGHPEQLTEPLHGRVWTIPEKDFAPEQYPDVLRLKTRLQHGTPWLRVVSDTSPGPRFSACTPRMEDGYFLALSQDTQTEAVHA